VAPTPSLTRVPGQKRPKDGNQDHQHSVPSSTNDGNMGDQITYESVQCYFPHQWQLPDHFPTATATARSTAPSTLRVFGFDVGHTFSISPLQSQTGSLTVQITNRHPPRATTRSS